MKRFHVAHTFLFFCLIGFLGCETPQEGAEPEAIVEKTQPVAPSVAQINSIENARIPTIALDADSQNVYVAFFQKDGEINNVYLASKHVDQEDWNTPVRASDGLVNASVHGQAPAQVVVGPEGNVYVVWTSSIPVEGRRFPASDLLFARSKDGGRTFDPPQAINSDAGEFPAGHTFQDITVANDGTIYVSWLDSRERYRAMAANHSPKTVQTVSHKHSASAHARHEPGTQVWVASSADFGETFSEGTVVAKETCQCCRTSIMVAEDGTVYVAWRHIFPNTERDMALAHSTDGGQTFTEPRRIYADNWSVEGCPHSGPSLTIDAAGVFHATWYTGVETHPGLYYSTSKDGVTFSEPTTLVAEVGVSQVQASGHGETHTWLTWEDKKAKGIQLAYTDETGKLTYINEAFSAGTLPSIATTSSLWAIASQVGDSVQVMHGTLK
ncbi:MAG: glycoside hydrolase [Rhodothermaceae bacterium]|nr:glycoside hydrolase [Rhodothermaceae bacterium]